MTQTRTEAELKELFGIAELVRRGAPIYEIGRAGPVPRAVGMRDVDEPEVLVLASGLLDDAYRHLNRGDVAYDLFLHVLRWQDTWSDDELSSFWPGGLQVWPTKRGKRSHTYALAYALVIAVEACVDLEDFLGRLGRDLGSKAISGLTREKFTLRGLQRIDAVRFAIEMMSAPRHLHLDSGRLPRVVTDEAEVPRLAIAHLPHEAFVETGAASAEIVRAAHRAVKDARPVEPRAL